MARDYSTGKPRAHWTSMRGRILHPRSTLRDGLCGEMGTGRQRVSRINKTSPARRLPARLALSRRRADTVVL
jgi:hypothetical protein